MMLGEKCLCVCAHRIPYSGHNYSQFLNILLHKLVICSENRTNALINLQRIYLNFVFIYTKKRARRRTNTKEKKKQTKTTINYGLGSGGKIHIFILSQQYFSFCSLLIAHRILSVFVFVYPFNSLYIFFVECVLMCCRAQLLSIGASFFPVVFFFGCILSI